jgi:hypothetical protein
LAKFAGKASVTAKDCELALTTLGDATKNRNDPLSAVPPKVAKASTAVCRCRWCYHTKLCQWKNLFDEIKSLGHFGRG